MSNATARTERVTVRVPPNVKIAWQRAATRAGLTLTAWLEDLAQVALTRPILPRQLDDDIGP